MTELTKLFLEEIHKFTGGDESHSEAFAGQLNKIAVTHLGNWADVALEWVKEGDLRQKEIKELKEEIALLRGWVKRLSVGEEGPFAEEIEQYFKLK